MAITRDYLYQADASANAQSLADWLTANAGDYFDECTAEDMAVTCSAGGTALMQITLSANNITITAADASGALAAFTATTGSAVRRMYYAWKCSHGIMLGISEIPSVFITKDIAENVIIAAWNALSPPASASTGTQLKTASLNATAVTNKAYTLPLASGKTVLSPILMTDNDGTVLPYMFFTPYSQYSDVGILTVDGTEYLYSGCIAICDGEAGTSGSTDLTNYYTKTQTDAQVKTGVAELRTELTAHAAPMQDASVEGQYMLYAEYTFPKSMNFESSDITLLIRNRGVLTVAKDGILRVRLRYGKASAAFQYAQIYWMIAAGIDVSKFVLCYNDATATARLYIATSTAYDGYICKVLDMGTSANVVDFAAWTLYSPTTGTEALPTEDEGWVTVTSTDSATTEV